jgi:hypothetical protein
MTPIPVLRCLRLIATGVLAAVLLRFLILSGSDAYHPNPRLGPDEDGDTIPDRHKHLLSMTNTTLDKYCVNRGQGSNWSVTAYYNRIRNVLELGDSQQRWDGLGKLGEARVELAGVVTGPPCETGTHIFVTITTNSGPCEAGESCAFPGTTWDFNPLTGHEEARYYTVLLQPNHIEDNGFHPHIINHEFGHVFGLDDGAGPNDCPDSVMHDTGYGCDVDRQYASDLDLLSAQHMIPSALGGGGGGGGRGCPFALPC